MLEQTEAMQDDQICAECLIDEQMFCPSVWTTQTVVQVAQQPRPTLGTDRSLCPVAAEQTCNFALRQW